MNAWLANIFNPEPTNNTNGSNGGGGGQPPIPPIVPNQPGHAQDTNQSTCEESERDHLGRTYMGHLDDNYYRNKNLYTPSEQAQQFNNTIEYHNLRTSNSRGGRVSDTVARHPDGERLSQSYFEFLQRQRTLLPSHIRNGYIIRINNGLNSAIRTNNIVELSNGGLRPRVWNNL